MHPTAEQLGSLLFERHWKPSYKRILDIGSLDINGSLRESAPKDAEYIGIDLEAGKGVDTILEDPYKYPYPDNHFDMIVSTSCFEHDPMFWLTFLEASRVLADGGIFYINAPSNGHYHTHPWDNWRFYPDASFALQMWAERNKVPVIALESFTMTRCGPWNDYVMVFTKENNPSDIARSIYLSDWLPGVCNIRKRGFPGQVINKHIETDDLRENDRLAALVFSLQNELADLKKKIRLIAEISV